MLIKRNDYIKFGWKSIGFTDDNQLEILCVVGKSGDMDVVSYKYFYKDGEGASGSRTISLSEINMFIDMKKELGV